jgi:hypothetical protein
LLLFMGRWSTTHCSFHSYGGWHRWQVGSS